MCKFKHIISLGYFCSTALELRRIGVRDASYPLDWVISYDLDSILHLIKNHFGEYLSEELLYQLNEVPSCYRNKKYKVDFYHDFDELIGLKKQLPDVKKKYNRRINRFYDTIKLPTLFIRNVSSSTEMIYIYNNFEKIQSFFKSFNSLSEVHFIVNSDIYCEKQIDENIWYLKSTNSEAMNGEFLEKNVQLKNYILENVEYRRPTSFVHPNHQKSFIQRVYRKICMKLKLGYRHNQTVAHADK